MEIEFTIIIFVYTLIFITIFYIYYFLYLYLLLLFQYYNIIFCFSVLAGVLWLCILIFYVIKVLVPNGIESHEIKREIIVKCIQIILLVISLQIIFVQSKRFELDAPISQFFQSACWIISGKVF